MKIKYLYLKKKIFYKFKKYFVKCFVNKYYYYYFLIF